MRPLDSREFFRMLHGRTKKSAGRVDAALRDRAEREITVFICDSSGFTRKSHQYGIAQFLSVMTRGYRSLAPIFKKCGGLIVSQNADNLVAVFPEPARAVKASIEIQRKLRKYNTGRHDSEQFHLCIGIEHGPCYVLTDNIYGTCVNVASKIGEDLAGKGQILVTGVVAASIKGRIKATYDRSAEIGGKLFELYKVPY